MFLKIAHINGTQISTSLFGMQQFPRNYVGKQTVSCEIHANLCNWRAKSNEKYIRRCKLEMIPEFTHHILHVHPVSAHKLSPRTDIRPPELEHLAEQRQQNDIPRLCICRILGGAQ